MISPDEIDWHLLINEVDTEVAADGGWNGEAEFLAKQCANAGTGLVYVTDCEGEFVCLASRPMAEFLITMLNDLPDAAQNNPEEAAAAIRKRNYDRALASCRSL